MEKRCPKAGLRVCFRSSGIPYRDSPSPGECGTVDKIMLPGGKATCLSGPRGGLVYVRWDRVRFQGVFRSDLVRERSGKPLTGNSRRRSR